MEYKSKAIKTSKEPDIWETLAKYPDGRPKSGGWCKENGQRSLTMRTKFKGAKKPKGGDKKPSGCGGEPRTYPDGRPKTGGIVGMGPIWAEKKPSGIWPESGNYPDGRPKTGGSANKPEYEYPDGRPIDPGDGSMDKGI